MTSPDAIAETGLLACWCPVELPAISPLMQGQAAVAARFALNKAAHAADAPKHDYLSFKGNHESHQHQAVQGR